MDRAQTGNGNAGILFKATAAEVFTDADAVILATEWHQYKTLPFASLAQTMHTRVFLDGRNFLNPRDMTAAGYRYIGVGR